MTLGFTDVNFDVSAGVETGGNSEGYLPPNTTFNVKADGSGDFATIKDAIDYLEGKWSTGTVTIELGEGTFVVDSSINIQGQHFNIPYLKLQGSSSGLTEIQADISGVGILVAQANVAIAKLTLNKVSKKGYGIQCDLNGWVMLSDVIIENCSTACLGLCLSMVHLGSNLLIKNCNTGMRSERLARVCSNIATNITFQNVDVAWSVSWGGMIATSTSTTNITYTSVTTKCSQTVGTFAANGYIGGTLQN